MSDTESEFSKLRLEMLVSKRMEKRSGTTRLAAPRQDPR